MYIWSEIRNSLSEQPSRIRPATSWISTINLFMYAGMNPAFWRVSQGLLRCKLCAEKVKNCPSQQSSNRRPATSWIRTINHFIYAGMNPALRRVIHSSLRCKLCAEKVKNCSSQHVQSSSRRPANLWITSPKDCG